MRDVTSVPHEKSVGAGISNVVVKPRGHVGRGTIACNVGCMSPRAFAAKSHFFVITSLLVFLGYYTGLTCLKEDQDRQRRSWLIA